MSDFEIFLTCFFSIIIIFFAAYLFLVLPSFKKPEGRKKFQRAMYAHRGLHCKENHIPENSISAFQLAVENGYGIELDVHLSSDGICVVTHDDSLLRMCGVDLKVSENPYNSFKDIKIKGTDEVTPVFADVLSLVDGKVPLLVELKTDNGNYKALCEAASVLLDAYQGDYCIESFDPRAVGWFKKNRPCVYRGQLSCHISTKSAHGAYAILLRGLCANFISRPHFVAYSFKDSRCSFGFHLCRAIGADVFYWTIRNEDNAKKALEKGGSIIFEGFNANNLKINE